MSDKLKIGPLNERKALFELGYNANDIKKLSSEERTNIITNQIKAPGKTVLSKQDRLNQGATRLNNSLLPKLEAIAKRTGIPIDQLKTGKWEKHKYYNPTRSEMSDINTYVGKMNSLKKQGWVPQETDKNNNLKINPEVKGNTNPYNLPKDAQFDFSKAVTSRDIRISKDNKPIKNSLAIG
tara:strand:- start:153 stop:695 length:543 start_codon:yes stop_codon:yes gene_type:complete